MTIFDPSEKVEFIAIQPLYYDRYSGCQYFLEQVNVNGKCGLIAERSQMSMERIQKHYCNPSIAK